MSRNSSPAPPIFIQRLESYEEFRILHNLIHYPEARVEGYVNQIIDECRVAMTIFDRNPEKGAAVVDSALFQSLMELVQRLEPPKHEKLVQLVSELQTRVLRHPDTGEVLMLQDEAFFEGLPALGWAGYEALDERGGQYHDIDDPDMDPQQQERWVNLNAFMAQLTQAAQLREPVCDPRKATRMDRTHYGVWVMTVALENNTRSSEDLVRSAAVKAACMWFIYAGHWFWLNVRCNIRYVEGYGTGPGSKYPGKSWTGHEFDRWLAWMRGLQDMKAVCASEEMDQLLNRAVQKMREAMLSNRPHSIHLVECPF